MDTPVAINMFRRAANTRRVFEVVRRAKPKKLFIMADGPRTEADLPLCLETRAVTEQIDWDCEVRRKYSEVNLGIRKHIPEGISWVFEHVDRAIILENDCVPNPTFFDYCDILLERYKNDERVMHISGDNFHQQNPAFKPKDSYYFSVTPHIWGWATWARSWKKYDLDMKLWPQAKAEGWLKNVFTDPAVLDRWEHTFQSYYEGTARSWDGQWAFACFINNALCINPATNLISNIGFGAGATNTHDPKSFLANLPTQAMQFPLTHPLAMLPNRMYDAYIFKHVFEVNKYPRQRARWFFKSRFPREYAALKRLFK